MGLKVVTNYAWALFGKMADKHDILLTNVYLDSRCSLLSAALPFSSIIGALSFASLKLSRVKIVGGGYSVRSEYARFSEPVLERNSCYRTGT